MKSPKSLIRIPEMRQGEPWHQLILRSVYETRFKNYGEANELWRSGWIYFWGEVERTTRNRDLNGWYCVYHKRFHGPSFPKDLPGCERYTR